MRHRYVAGGVAVAAGVAAMVAAQLGSQPQKPSGDSGPSGGSCATAGGGSCAEGGQAETEGAAPAVGLEPPTRLCPYPRLPVLLPPHERVWSTTELALHNGTDPTLPLLLVIVGEVYDVGPGHHFYAPGNGYSHFAGGDDSRHYSDVEENETQRKRSSELLDLGSELVSGVIGWRKFYRTHRKYRFVGLHAERYFDAAGVPLPAHGEVERLAAIEADIQKMQKDLDRRFRTCNSRHVNSNPNVDLWCDDSYHPRGSIPVHLYYTLPSREEQGRCACVSPEQRISADSESAWLQQQHQPGVLVFRIVDYVECEKKQRCQRPKDSKPP